MKILHILSTPRAEGTPNLVLDWLSVPGHAQEVSVLHHQPADLTEELRARANWYGEAELFTGRGPRKFLRIANTVRCVCRERRPDLVVCWATAFANWVCLGARLARGLRVRVVVHCGNPPGNGTQADWMGRYVMWPVALLGGRCACCSRYVRDLYQAVPGLPAGLFTAILNCARVAKVRERVAAGADSQLRAGGIMVATLERHKDHATLLRAMPDILAQRPDFRLRLVGDGTLRSELERLATELNVSGAVEFLGTRRDVPEWLGRSALFVFSTTEQEGLGSVLIEALAAGLPVVASDVPACRELLAGGRWGRLVPAADPASLAGGVLASLAGGGKPSLGLEKVDEVNAYLEEFSPPRMMTRYMELAFGPATDK